MRRFEHLKPKLRPWVFVGAIVVGFLACVLMGRTVSQNPVLKNEVRLNEFLNPMFHFYPTASMLAAAALDGLTADQTLVLIGGNSNFNGQGQNPDELWSLELQRLLGDAYKVVNFATMGSKSADLAGVVFRMIEVKHPKTLLVLNSYSVLQGSFDGSDDYDIPAPALFTYVFWDAYYKNLIPSDDAFEAKVHQLQKREFVEHANEFTEIHLGAIFDGFTYARDLWTFLDYESFFTLWFAPRADKPFQARKFVTEPKRVFPGLEERVAKSGMTFDEIMQNVRGHFQGIARYGVNGAIEPVPEKWQVFRDSHDRLFTPSQRSRVFLYLLWPSPHFAKKLSKEDKALLDYVIPHATDELLKQGYHASSIGRDFDDEDYETSFHFMASGGHKIARLVADQIKAESN